MAARLRAVSAAKRAHCRRAGQWSGVVRRRTAIKRRGLIPAEQRGLPLHYELRQLSRQEFDARYATVRARPERPTAAASWERMREAVWQEFMGSWRLVSARGQHCHTTNEQRRHGLALRGLERHHRSLQRYHRQLEAMGLATFRQPDCGRCPGGAKRGRYMVVEWRVTRRLPILLVTPPSGTANTWLRQGCSPPQSTATTSLPPPTAADGEPAAPRPEHPGTETDQLEAQIAFQQLKLDIGFGPPDAIRAKLTRLRSRRDALAREAAADAQPPQRDSDGPHSAP